MLKKAYIHLESKDANLPASTLIVNFDQDSTVHHIQEKITNQLLASTGKTFDAASIVLMNERGKSLSKSTSSKVIDIFEDQDGKDLFVFNAPKILTAKINPPVENSSAVPKATTSSTQSTKASATPVQTAANASETTAKTTAATTATVKPASTTASTSTNKSSNISTTSNREVVEAHRKLQEYMKKKQYKFCKPLADVLIQNNVDPSFAHNCLALIAIESQNLDESIRHCKNAIQADRTNPNSYYILGKAYIQKGQFEEAADNCEKGAKVWKARAAVTPAKDRDEHLYLDMVALQAEAMFADGDHNDAANLLNSLMGNPNCDRNMNILVTYASFALQYRKLEEAVVAFLKSIALKTPDPRVTKLAVDILTTREGFQEFIRQFPPAMPESAEVYAFLGTLVKELSAMDTSVVLYQIATRLQPENPSYILNLVHVLEVKQSVDEAIELLRNFYYKNGNMGFRQQQSSNAVAMNTTCARMLEAMQPPSSSSGRRCQITWVMESASNHHRGFALVEQIATTTPASEGNGFSASASASASASSANNASAAEEEDDAPSSDFCTSPTTALSRSSSNGSTKGNASAQPTADSASSSVASATTITTSNDSGAVMSVLSPYDDADHHMYTFVTRELDLIALYATTVKVFYLKGLLSHLPMMFTLVERIRAMSQVSLHETLVRNELAYYQDIVQIMSVRTHGALYGLPDVSFALNDPMKSAKVEWCTARSRPIYLCGDSHCLSGGWSILEVHGLPRLIIPKLVTGIKHWHLRPESRFYPKENFLQTIASIPIGSEVIFNIGEIDCREGLLGAIEKGQYASLEEGMKKTVSIFVKILKDLKKSRKFRMYIHPVPPVLNETRAIVMMYNAVYRKAVQELQDDNILWLDFVGDLVVDTVTATLGSQMSEAELSFAAGQRQSLQLRDKYRHDGTHLNPLYLELVEANLNRLPPAPTAAVLASNTSSSSSSAGAAKSSSSSSGSKR